MAGIGFLLRRLTRRPDLIGALQGYAWSALVSSGPWLTTVLAVAGVTVLTASFETLPALVRFRLVLIYNFGFSLAFTWPVVLVTTRHVADLIFARDVRGIPGVLLAALAGAYGLQLPLVVAFYGLVADLTPLETAIAVAQYFTIVGIWVAGVFLTALKDYRAVAGVFITGMIAAFALAVALLDAMGAAGIAGGFTLGLLLIFGGLTAKVLAEYPYRPAWPAGLITAFRRHRTLAAAGLAYGLGIWIDKWVMWLAPEAGAFPSGLIAYPAYDAAMFFAWMTTVPAVAIFLVAIETDFADRYNTFYGDIRAHATLDRIQANQRALDRSLGRRLRDVMVVQGTLSVLVVLVSPEIFDAFPDLAIEFGIFRLGVLGAFFQVMFMFLTVVITYLDRPGPLLAINLVFVLSNGGLTALTLHLGFPWYGAGYALAGIVTFAVAWAVCLREISRLPYLTFIGNNPSLR